MSKVVVAYAKHQRYMYHPLTFACCIETDPIPPASSPSALLTNSRSVAGCPNSQAATLSLPQTQMPSPR